MSTTPDVLIVGAGLAGLACARHLHQFGAAVRILEATDGVGGRVRTDRLEGFQLDRGFQVLLEAYPEALQMLDYGKLRLHSFRPGALIHAGNGFHLITDPFRDMPGALRSLFSPVGSLSDKLLVAKLRKRLLQTPLNEIFERPETTTLAALRDLGFSSRMIDRFFRPFFGGILLDRELRPSSRMFEFVFKMMSSGNTSLPEAGMGAIPEQLAEALPPHSIELETRVATAEQGKVELFSGQVRQARAIVIATDGPQAAQWLGDGYEPGSRSVACLYFDAPEPPVKRPYITLNGESGLVNNLCVPSVVCPSYAPPGRALVSVSVLGVHSAATALEKPVRQELSAWFGRSVEQWRFLRSYAIQHAQPRSLPEEGDCAGVRLKSGLYVCGDHRATPSVQGALLSGRKAAEAVWEDLSR